MNDVGSPTRRHVLAASSAMAAGLVAATVTSGTAHAQANPPASTPLASWNEGRTKAAIVNFVERVTRPGSPDFVAPADRIAVFDNDGTLWVEHPMYVQLAFALDRVKAMAPDASGMEGQAAFQGGSGRGHEGAGRSGRRRFMETC